MLPGLSHLSLSRAEPRSAAALFNRHPEARGAPVFLVALPLLFMVLLVILSLASIPAKWVLMWRYREGRHPIWGSGYLRWWTVRQSC